jgi:dTDP-4-dehydrorhamnose 3,5-epimerase
MMHQTDIQGVYEIKIKSYPDHRGYFFEVFNQSELEKNEIHYSVSQINQSFSRKGVLRGLHFQKPPQAQAKWVRVISGQVFDVVVDLRFNSSTFGQWLGIILKENENMLLIPDYCAHGFLTLTDTAIVEYLCSKPYAPNLEESILYKDPTLNIQWPFQDVVVSEKDNQAPYFEKNRVYF